MDSVFSIIGSYINLDFKSLLVFTAVFILTADYIKNRRPANFPPGPWALPLVGSLFSIDQTKTHEILTSVTYHILQQIRYFSLLSLISSIMLCLFSNLLTASRKIWRCVQPENGPDMDGGVKQVWGCERSSSNAGGELD